MKKYLTRKNIGWALTVIISYFLAISAFTKITGHEEATAMLNSGNMGDWILIVGIGELVSLLLFIIPKTMKLGTLLLSAYFGGAILFHMVHQDPAQQGFVGPVVFLLAVWAISWVRGNDLIS